MSRLLVPVSACNEEHGSTIGNSCENGTGGNSSTRGVDLAAASSVTWKSTAMATVVSCTWRCVVLVGLRAAGAIGEATVHQRPGGVHERRQLIDGGARLTVLVNVMVEERRRLS